MHITNVYIMKHSEHVRGWCAELATHATKNTGRGG
jgi:hypothetical protein